MFAIRTMLREHSQSSIQAPALCRRYRFVRLARPPDRLSSASGIATIAAVAGVAELVDAVALGATAFGRAGSSPVPGTKPKHRKSPRDFRDREWSRTLAPTHHRFELPPENSGGFMPVICKCIERIEE